MKENFHLPLTKREAKQLFEYLLIREGKPIKENYNDDYWERHESIATKLQGIIYKDGVDKSKSKTTIIKR